ncbi:MAG: thiol-disulfide oxidoreductase DCC family protein [Gemmatimonadales bacterium]
MLNRPVLLFDGNCGFCRRWVRRLQRWDRAGAIDYVPAAERGSVPGVPPLADAALDRAMHLVTRDGQVYAGARALSPLLAILPGGRLLAPLMRVPGVQPLADWVYAWVAARRHRFGCGPARC